MVATGADGEVQGVRPGSPARFSCTRSWTCSWIPCSLPLYSTNNSVNSVRAYASLRGVRGFPLRARGTGVVPAYAEVLHLSL